MVAGKIGAVADRKVRMASKTAGAAEKLNGGSGKMEDMADTMDGVCDKFAPMSQVVGTSVAQLLRKRAMCKWSQNKLLGMAENTTMAAVFA